MFDAVITTDKDFNSKFQVKDSILTYYVGLMNGKLLPYFKLAMDDPKYLGGMCDQKDTYILTSNFKDREERLESYRKNFFELKDFANGNGTFSKMKKLRKFTEEYLSIKKRDEFTDANKR